VSREDKFLVSIFGIVGFVPSRSSVIVVTIVPNRDAGNAANPNVVLISEFFHNPSRMEFQTSPNDLDWKESSIRKDLGDLQCVNGLDIVCRAQWNPDLDVNEHFVPATGKMINDTGNGIEFNGIPDRPNGGLSGKAIAVGVSVLVDAKAELDKKQVFWKIPILATAGGFDQLGSQT